jgi:hypothetical protein
MVTSEVLFSGSGTVELPEAEWCDTGPSSRGDLKRCVLRNTDLVPTLSAPVQIKPFEPWAPWVPYEFPEECVQRSDYPTWEVNDFFYAHKAPEHYISFNLTNMANGGRMSCSIEVNTQLSRSTAHSQQWAACNGQQDPSMTGDVSNTQVMFDSDYGLLGIKQNWKCGGNDGQGMLGDK